MDSHARSIAKAVTWRVGGTLVTACVAYVVTGRAESALAIGAVDTVLKVGAYYAHERLWARVKFGQKSPDYEI